MKAGRAAGSQFRAALDEYATAVHSAGDEEAARNALGSTDGPGGQWERPGFQSARQQGVADVQKKAREKASEQYIAAPAKMIFKGALDQLVDFGGAMGEAVYDIGKSLKELGTLKWSQSGRRVMFQADRRFW